MQYLDLSLNFLPALQTLQKDKGLFSTYKSGERLSFGLDGNPLTGNGELDHWIKAGEGVSKRLMNISTVYTSSRGC